MTSMQFGSHRAKRGRAPLIPADDEMPPDEHLRRALKLRHPFNSVDFQEDDLDFAARGAARLGPALKTWRIAIKRELKRVIAILKPLDAECRAAMPESVFKVAQFKNVGFMACAHARNPHRRTAARTRARTSRRARRAHTNSPRRATADNVLAGGMLTGKYLQTPAAVDNPDRAAALAALQAPRGRMDERGWGYTLYRYRSGPAGEATRAYAALAKKYGMPLTELSLRWARERAAVTTRRSSCAAADAADKISSTDMRAAGAVAIQAPAPILPCLFAALTSRESQMVSQ